MADRAQTGAPETVATFTGLRGLARRCAAGKCCVTHCQRGERAGDPVRRRLGHCGRYGPCTWLYFAGHEAAQWPTGRNHLIGRLRPSRTVGGRPGEPTERSRVVAGTLPTIFAF